MDGRRRSGRLRRAVAPPGVVLGAGAGGAGWRRPAGGAHHVDLVPEHAARLQALRVRLGQVGM
eukprot:138296-Pyramimonas_sp.AAC.1